MADTQPLAPTDAELMDPGHECELDAIAFGRAVLAKWGAQPVVRKPLTPEKIDEIAGPADYFDRRVFARAIESEVRKQDTELIRQLVEAMEYKGRAPWKKRQPALIAGRARLEGKL